MKFEALFSLKFISLDMLHNRNIGTQVDKKKERKIKRKEDREIGRKVRK